MRYLFAIQGEGRGHLTQAISMAQILKQNGDMVCAVIIGKSPKREIPEFFIKKIGAPVISFEAPQFRFDKDNRKVDLKSTVIENSTPSRISIYLRNMRRIMEKIMETGPDRIINFYEILTSLAVRRYKIPVPMIGIGHQFLFNSSNYPYSHGHGIGGMMLRLHSSVTSSGCRILLGLSFRNMKCDYSKKIFPVPPLLREEALDGISSDGNYILAYMVNNGYAEELKRWCASHPECTVHAFWDNPEAPDELKAEGGLTLHRLNDTLFLKYMKNCSGYITTAGFESVCEAMYHNKPMMLIPTHIEQQINAAEASDCGNCIVADRFDPDILLEFMKNRNRSDIGFNNWENRRKDLIMGYLNKL